MSSYTRSIIFTTKVRQKSLAITSCEPISGIVVKMIAGYSHIEINCHKKNEGSWGLEGGKINLNLIFPNLTVVRIKIRQFDILVQPRQNIMKNPQNSSVTDN